MKSRSDTLRESSGPGGDSGGHALTIVYDGECEVCRRLAAWARTRSRGRSIRFLSCVRASERYAPALRREQCGTAAAAIPRAGAPRFGADALALLAAQLGYRSAARLLSSRATAPLARLGYAIVSRHRGLLLVFPCLRRQRSR
jgi:predicted DCC family thiol-disulfide oxidoreductase YuxK